MSNEIIKYKLTFPKTQIRATYDYLTFKIGNIKSRTISVAYFKFYGYDYHENQVAEYTSKRWVITNNYEMVYDTFNIKELLEDTTIDDLYSYVIEMYLIGVNSENPLYMNKLMLYESNEPDEGEKEWHMPDELAKDVQIGFLNNSYVNLYNEDYFLQIIRPFQDGLTTKNLGKSQMTILAPHLMNESTWDNPVNLFYEYMYMIEQKIGVEK